MKASWIELDLAKIHDNARILTERLHRRGISVMGISKVMLGAPLIAKTLLSAGVQLIGDSRIENIRRMKEGGVEANFALIRTPFKSQASDVVACTQISFNTELSVVEELSRAAIDQNKVHEIVVMVELGDLREGVPQDQLNAFIGSVIDLEGIEIYGIGTNLACFGGVKPNNTKMEMLSSLAKSIESNFNITLKIVSGGNSANFEWLSKTEDIGKINNLRLGESIFLGVETLHRNPIEGLHLDAITLITEVIESKTKPSMPDGEFGQNAFGQQCEFVDKGNVCRSIVGMGRQDVDVNGLIPMGDFDILGSSSDHIILDSTRAPLKVGDRVRFKLNYSSLLSAMTSPFIEKVFVGASLD